MLNPSSPSKIQKNKLSTESNRDPPPPSPQFQEINVQNMNIELVAQMFKNYQSNVLFHLEGKKSTPFLPPKSGCIDRFAT